MESSKSEILNYKSQYFSRTNRLTEISRVLYSMGQILSKIFETRWNVRHETGFPSRLETRRRDRILRLVFNRAIVRVMYVW
jgi:hypothetical protein